MSNCRKRKFRFATFSILPVLLTFMALVPAFLSFSSRADALDTTQWEKMRGYINSYYGGSQYNAAQEGEAGFRIGKIALWNRLDSNGDISPNAGAGVGSTGTTVTGVLGNGDDMANRPVLVDNLMTQTAFIPGTEFRCNWNVDQSCFSDSSITAIRELVDAHKAAGFSTDIVDHCVSSQTAGPSTGGFGIIAQVPGALSSDTSLIPNVYIADYSRNGWRNSLSTASGAEAIASPETSAGGFSAPSTVANCDASATDYDLVLCQANWAISSTGGNVGNGQMTIATIAAAGQSVDVRNGTITTMSSAGTNLQTPINTLFSTSSLANLDPTQSTVLASRTQMGATSAIGLRMLGYNLIAGGSISTGISRWNGTLGEAQVAYGDGLPLQSVAAYSVPGKVDTTAPTQSGINSVSITSNSAVIERDASEPATMKVQYGTTQGGPYTETVNDTVLQDTNKQVSLTGLSTATTYYYVVTSYDGYANASTTSSENSFITLQTYGAIGAKYNSLGGASGFLGTPTSEEYDVAGVAGARVQNFTGGRIYWSAATGAHEMHGLILTEYLGLDPAILGLPTSDEIDVSGFAGGRKSELTGATIYWSAGTGAHEVHGAIRGKWLVMGGPAVFGLPTSDEADVSGVTGGRWNSFQVGNIYWSSATGAHEMHGLILVKYLSLGPAAFGLPTSDETGVPGYSPGRVSVLQNANAAIYWSSATGAYEVHGDIRGKWLVMGGPAVFGMPTSDEADVSGVTGGRWSQFQYANIYWSLATSAHEVHGAILAKYLEYFAGTPGFGLPTSDEYASGSGRRSDFVSGYIYWDAAGGAVVTD